MKLNQAFWPSIADDEPSTYGVPIGYNMNVTTKDLTPLRFWQEAYLTSLEVGIGAYAKQIADTAVKDLAQHTGLVYSQNEGGNTPYTPEDAAHIMFADFLLLKHCHAFINHENITKYLTEFDAQRLGREKEQG